MYIKSLMQKACRDFYDSSKTLWENIGKYFWVYFVIVTEFQLQYPATPLTF